MNVADFIRLYQLRAPNIMWLLGAGASAASGVPTAYHLIWRFKQLLYCSNQRVSIRACSDLGDPSLQARLQNYFDTKGGFPPSDSDEEYAYYFEDAFPSEADRRRYIDETFSAAHPSYGHIALASLIKLDKARIVWTTNFDPLIEDAIANLYGKSGHLISATTDSPQLAMQAINEGRFPLLGKLHGDFRSRKLKNITDELRAQDAELKHALVESCKRYGLAVLGYSGRDHSVMDALVEAINDGKGYPSGLFWFHRPDTPYLSHVSDLIERAHKSGIEAHLIDIETFDELMADIISMMPELPDEIEKRLSGYARKVSNVPMPSGKNAWPVIRLNALPITSTPTVCRRIVCKIGGTKEVREAITKAAADVIGARRQIGIIAYGADNEIRKAFDSYDITEFDVHTIEPSRLRYESAEYGLLYDAICRALSRERPLIVERRRQSNIAAIDPTKATDRLFSPLKQAAGKIAGIIPGTRVQWTEAVRIRLEYRRKTVWLLLEPTIWTEKSDIDSVKIKNFIRDRLAGRYNSSWNKTIDAWANIITSGQRECTLKAFGISDGLDASFTISSVTGYSYREAR
jgi:hypothetical protein